MGDRRTDYVLSVTIKCLMTHLLDVVCCKNVISAMVCVDKIEHNKHKERKKSNMFIYISCFLNLSSNKLIRIHLCTNN